MNAFPDPLETRASLLVRLPDSADVAAWDEFLEIYAPLIYRLARSKGLQPADAEDLVQEVFAAVSRSLQQWLERSERGKFRAWLFCIAKNTAINFLTRARYRTLGTGDDRNQEQFEQLAADDPAVSVFDAEYERQVFRWASDEVRRTVAERTWEAFWRTTMENQSPQDVARALKMTVGSVYIARSRTMARLCKLVKKLEEDTSGSPLLPPDPAARS